MRYCQKSDLLKYLMEHVAHTGKTQHQSKVLIIDGPVIVNMISSDDATSYNDYALKQCYTYGPSSKVEFNLLMLCLTYVE